MKNISRYSIQFAVTSFLVAVLLLFSPDCYSQGIPIGPQPKKKDPEASTTRKKKTRTNRTNTTRYGHPIFTTHLGGGLHHYFGKTSKSFDSRKLSWQINGMLGVRYKNKPKSGAVGVFMTYGHQSEAGASLIFDNVAWSTYLEIEGGVLISELFRMSAGYGINYFGVDTSNPNTPSDQNYYTTTMGFYLGQKNFKFHVLGTALFSQQENSIAFRPVAGMDIKLNFLKRRNSS